MEMISIKIRMIQVEAKRRKLTVGPTNSCTVRGPAIAHFGLAAACLEDGFFCRGVAVMNFGERSQEIRAYFSVGSFHPTAVEDSG